MRRRIVSASVVFAVAFACAGSGESRAAAARGDAVQAAAAIVSTVTRLQDGRAPRPPHAPVATAALPPALPSLAPPPLGPRATAASVLRTFEHASCASRTSRGPPAPTTLVS